MNHRIKTVCCLPMIAFSSLSMGGCPGQDAFIEGVTGGLTGGVSNVLEDLLTNALVNDG